MHKYTGLPIDAVIGKPVRRTGLWRVPLTRLQTPQNKPPWLIKGERTSLFPRVSRVVAIVVPVKSLTAAYCPQAAARRRLLDGHLFGLLCVILQAQVGLFSSGYTVTDRHISLRKSIVLRRDRGFEGVFESGLGSNCLFKPFFTQFLLINAKLNYRQTRCFLRRIYRICRLLPCVLAVIYSIISACRLSSSDV